MVSLRTFGLDALDGLDFATGFLVVVGLATLATSFVANLTLDFFAVLTVAIFLANVFSDQSSCWVSDVWPDCRGIR